MTASRIGWMTSMRWIFVRLLFLLPLVWLAGCATLPEEPGTPPHALDQALGAGDCRAAYALLETTPGVSGSVTLRTAQVCLQVGDFTRARRVAADFLREQPTHPDVDYAAYVHALAGFGEWSRARSADPEARVREGRALFYEMAGHLRDRPLSEYASELAPRLVRLREGIAEAEFALAQREHRHGDPAVARARAAYVVEHYPRTQAAAEAARLLLTLGSD
jgi:outer membrane protein assembly factor BamD